MPEMEDRMAEAHRAMAESLTAITDEPLPEATLAATPSQDTSWEQALRELAETILLTLVIFLLIRNVVQNFRVEGDSMLPNLHNGQYLIVNRFAYCPGLHLDIDFLDIHWQKVWCIWQPRRGDIIVFRAPNQSKKDYIKRVIGLPGETVEIRRGQVLINGRTLNEPYETRRYTGSAPTVTLGPDQVYVMGDNRPNSNDSRSFGPLSIDRIVGKALLCYWPPRDWAIIPHYSFASEE